MSINANYQVGDVTVTRVPELILDANTPKYLYPDWNPAVVHEHEGWLEQGHIDAAHEHLIQSVHSWLLQTKHHTFLIDTGIGNDKDRPWAPAFNHLQLPYLERLKAAGVDPEAVDYVIMTHLHVDHVGWNTRMVEGRWLPTFPRAKYVLPQVEQEYYANPANYDESNQAKAKIYEDSILPIIEAGQAELIGPAGGEFLDGLTFHPTPGHSIGQMSISLTSQGKTAIFGGDVMHHPIQVYYPEWNSVYCIAAEQARSSRLWVLEQAAERKALYFSSHFAANSAGFVIRQGTGFRWQCC